MVIPSELLRREIVGQLAALGHEARVAESFDEALALLEGGAIDTLVLDVSAFATNVLAQLGRAMTRRRSVALIARVSVVTATNATTGRGRPVRREGARPASGKDSPWRVATYWLPFSRLAEFSTGLRGTNLN